MVKQVRVLNMSHCVRLMECYVELFVLNVDMECVKIGRSDSSVTYVHHVLTCLLSALFVECVCNV